MNWGNKLLLVFVAFGSLMSFMVYKCMKAPVNLVAKEYYKDELAYQQVIDGKGRSASLQNKVQLSQDRDHIRLQLPAEMKNRQVKGNVLFYNAADAGRDRDLALQLDTAAQQQVSVKSFMPGNYVVKITWEADNVHYYAEQPFIIQ